MYLYGRYLSLKGVPIWVREGLSIYYMGTWSLRVGKLRAVLRIAPRGLDTSFAVRICTACAVFQISGPTEVFRFRESFLQLLKCNWPFYAFIKENCT